MTSSYLRQWVYGLFSAIRSPVPSDKNHNLVLLTSFHGDGYRGNTRILYEKLQTHPQIKAVWMSRNRDLIKQLKERFGDDSACLMHTFEGLRLIRAAGAVLLTHGTSDFPFLYLPRQATVIQTYHGLPTKRGEYMRPEGEAPPGFFHRKILEYRFKPIDYFLSSSGGVSEIFQKRFGLRSTQLLETGYPAYDHLMKTERDRSILDDLLVDSAQANTVVLYTPTFRRKTKTRWFPFDDLDINQLIRFLEKHNVTVLIRPHPNENLDVSIYSKLSNRFVDAGQHVVEDIYRLLPAADAIITDYSSIYIEGLLLDIPSLFIPYDKESYERGMPLPYEEVTPGPHIKNQKEFEKALQEIATGTEYYQEERKRVRNLFFSDLSGSATENVITFLEENLNN